MAAVLYQLGQVMVHEGHYSRAHDLFHESLRLCNQLEERPGIAASLLGLGLATLLQGGYRQARVLLEESLLLHREIGLRRGVIEALEALAGAATMDGEYARAAHLLAAGEALRELTDQADGQAAKWLVGPWIEQAKSQLDSATFDAEWEQGRNMSEDEAVAYVLGPTLFMADGKHKMPLH
jgi:tetratricopeptide (TPR) repeat protein